MSLNRIKEISFYISERTRKLKPKIQIPLSVLKAGNNFSVSDSYNVSDIPFLQFLFLSLLFLFSYFSILVMSVMPVVSVKNRVYKNIAIDQLKPTTTRNLIPLSLR